MVDMITETLLIRITKLQERLDLLDQPKIACKFFSKNSIVISKY
jgi:hypothetical protein